MRSTGPVRMAGIAAAVAARRSRRSHHRPTSSITWRSGSRSIISSTVDAISRRTSHGSPPQATAAVSNRRAAIATSRMVSVTSSSARGRTVRAQNSLGDGIASADDSRRASRPADRMCSRRSPYTICTTVNRRPSWAVARPASVASSPSSIAGSMAGRAFGGSTRDTRSIMLSDHRNMTTDPIEPYGSFHDPVLHSMTPAPASVPRPALRVRLTRGPTEESRHEVHASVFRPDGSVVTWGDPDHLVQPRSAIKFVQALPLLTTGAADRYRRLRHRAGRWPARATAPRWPTFRPSTHGFSGSASTSRRWSADPDLPLGESARTDLVRRGRSTVAGAELLLGQARRVPHRGPGPRFRSPGLCRTRSPGATGRDRGDRGAHDG